jgi:AraC family transcriptional regulator of arabinose operon
VGDVNVTAPGDLPPRPGSEATEVDDMRSAFFDMAPGYHTLRSRGTATGLLFATWSGRGFFRNRCDAVHLTGPGDLTYFEPRREQEYGTLPEPGVRWKFDWVHFFPRREWSRLLALPPVAGFAGLRATSIPTEHGRRQIRELFLTLHADLRMPGLGRDDLAMNTLERMLLVARDARGHAGERVPDGRIAAALEIISQRPADRHTVPSLARAVGLSPSRFAHLFREETGLPVVETVLRTRLREAQMWLEMTRVPVSEIAYRVGFGSAKYFSTQFAKHMGKSPLAFRRG